MLNIGIVLYLTDLAVQQGDVLDPYYFLPRLKLNIKHFSTEFIFLIDFILIQIAI